MLTPADIQSIERAVVAAVAPEAIEEIPGWLLPFDTGTVGRAKTAVPLTHEAPRPGALESIEARYDGHGMPAAFRVPDKAAFESFRRALGCRGYALSQPTQMHTAATATVARLIAQPRATISEVADDDWASVFLGPGFDPVDGASRVARLSRAEGSVFATLREDGVPVAAGVGAFGHGWASFHGMRTASASRGRGLARDVLSALAAHAVRRGFQRCMLQVEANNGSALALYRRAGFEVAWTYGYWRV